MNRINVDPELCKGCGLCIQVCPRSIIQMSEEYNSKGMHFVVQLQEPECTACTLCAIQCPDAAIEVYKGGS